MNKKLLIACSMGELWTTLGQAQTPIPTSSVPTGDVAAEREQLKAPRGGRRDYINDRRDALQDLYYSRR